MPKEVFKTGTPKKVLNKSNDLTYLYKKYCEAMANRDTKTASSIRWEFKGKDEGYLRDIEADKLSPSYHRRNIDELHTWRNIETGEQVMIDDNGYDLSAIGNSLSFSGRSFACPTRLAKVALHEQLKEII